MDGVIENDMSTSKQEPEAVREKIRQLENRQKQNRLKTGSAGKVSGCGENPQNR